MEISDQSVTFGDFSGLDSDTFQKVYHILHGAKEGGGPVEFPWNGPDYDYQEDVTPQPATAYCPVDAAPPITAAPIFVQPYPPVPGAIYPVQAVVAPYPHAVPALVNGLPLGQPYPPPVPVPRETICNYPPEEAHMVQSPPRADMCNGPSVGMPPGGPAEYNHVQEPEEIVTESAEAQQVHGAQNEFDFVYSEPGSEIPVSTSSELIQRSQCDNSSSTDQGSAPRSKDGTEPDRTTDVSSLGETVPTSINEHAKSAENQSANATVAQDSNLPCPNEPTPDPQPPTPPKPKSWAGLFKGTSTSTNAIVTYAEDTRRDASPQPVAAPEPKAPPMKMPVPVSEDSAAGQLGDLLKGLKMNHSSVAIQPRGLVNRGNWCYINSTLQALLACPPFYHLMKKLCEFSPLARGSNSSSTPILDSLIAFFNNFSIWSRPQGLGRGKKLMELNTGPSFEPVNVYKMLQVIEANPHFKLGKQEDAEEFLNCILDGLHEEMAASISLLDEDAVGEEVHENGYVDDDEGSEEDEDSWQQVGPKKKSVQTRRAAFAKTPIADIFAGHIRSAVYKASSKESATLEPFFTLKLDIQHDKIWTVRDALDGLVSKESVQGYQCSKTNQEVEVVRKITLEELPPVLILHLKCFIFDKTGGSQKVLKKIDFDVDLNITKDLLSSTAKAKIQHTHRSYKLFAVVFHHGKNTTGGHYTTDVFHSGMNSWVHIDDSRIQTVPVSNVLKYTPPRMPYLLYYRRTDLS